MTEPTPSLPPTSGSSSKRILSLDQFRGYTVVGMLLVNYLGSFNACPTVLRHSHDYISYADTIMPQFLFAVGFAFRLTFGRRAARQGAAAAYWHMVRRLLGLVLISIVIYNVSPPADSWEALVGLDKGELITRLLKRNWFQTLMHIAVTSLWILPVIRSGVVVRTLWMLGSAAAHVGLSYWFAYVWVNSDPNGIDGGPLGFLTWTIPAMMGTFACDAIAGAKGKPKLGLLVLGSFLLMGFGWVISCGTRMYDVPPDKVEEMAGQKLADDPVFPPMDRIKAHFEQDRSQLLAEPPFVPPPHSAVSGGAAGDEPEADGSASRGPFLKWLLEPVPRKKDESDKYRKWNYWMMSQRGGTLSYLTFSAGFSLFVYVLFYIACDIGSFRSTFFNSFGVNALAAYILHEMVGEAIKPFVPRDVPGWYMTASLVLFFAVNYVILRHLEKEKIYLKL